MKKWALTAIIAAFVSFALGQDITLKIGTEGTYQLAKGSGDRIILIQVSNIIVNQIFDLNNNVFKDRVDTNLVKIAFVKGMIRDTSQTFLIIKSGSTGFMKFSAKIKKLGQQRFISTNVDTVNGVVGLERIWPYEISEIELFDFHWKASR